MRAFNSVIDRFLYKHIAFNMNQHTQTEQAISIVYFTTGHLTFVNGNDSGTLPICASVHSCNSGINKKFLK
jgi:hypothetical protein